MKVLELDLQSLPPGRSALETEVGPADLEVAEEQYQFTKPIRVLLDIDKGDEDIMLRGTIVAPADVQCSRCLEPYEDDVNVPFSLVVHRLSAESPMLRDGVDEEGILFIPRSAASVELRDEVRSALILALPINPVCRADCRGLCPICGRDLNEGACGCESTGTDSRWAALEALRRREPDSGRRS